MEKGFSASVQASQASALLRSKKRRLNVLVSGSVRGLGGQLFKLGVQEKVGPKAPPHGFHHQDVFLGDAHCIVEPDGKNPEALIPRHDRNIDHRLQAARRELPQIAVL